jgi:L-ascorbate metabolism protein UlaG (beta-lactamase superfamily)
MNISWYGHRCVRVEAKEGTALIDPFDPKEVGLRGPTINDDIVIMTSAVTAQTIEERIGEESFVIRGPGEYERKLIAIKGILSYQDSQEGKELGLSTIYTLIAEDVSVCHLGALGQGELTSDQIEFIGEPDVLIVPVGGQGAFDAKVAVSVVNAIEPKVIIPVGFALPNASYDADPLDKFIKELGLTPQTMETFRINKKQLPTDQTLLVVLSA